MPLLTLSTVLASIGLALALVAAAMLVLSARRRAADFALELDRLHDEVWELREAAAARDRAEAANEAKSRFLASVSHEVRTPLNGILGMAELLGGTGLSPEQQAYVAAIRSSGSALAALIDEILDFSKIEAGKVDLADENFDVVALVEGVAELLAPRAQGKSLEIASTIAADVPREVTGDPVRLRQILLNLAGNAVKFTEAGGVGLSVTRLDSNQLRFDVVDTGPGVPTERRAAIFEEFEQADDATPRLHGGTGLGLAISKRLAERMGGMLTLEGPSTSSRDADRPGSLFSVILPLPASGDGLPSDETANLAGRRALVVADSPFEAPFLMARLREASADAIHAADVEGGIARLESGVRYDLVVIDCALGETATRRLGEAARQAGAARIIVLFSPYERRAFGQASAGRFDGWLVKPVRKRSLFALLAADAMNGDAMQAAPTPPPLPGPRPEGFSVLLAEDNAINALLATRHLERLGAAVTHAPDGLAALALIEAGLDAGTPYDAMVLDIRMPGLDGLELARRVRRAEDARGAPAARILALSADLVDADRRSASLSGIDACLGKPISFARLEQALDGLRERAA